MTDANSSTVLLRRSWASNWDAARFSAATPLHKPAFSVESCAAQLDLAAQAVVRLREAIGANVHDKHVLPLEGGSNFKLQAALDGHDVLPVPAKDPPGFVRALVHAAMQTGDGDYGLGFRDAVQVDELLDKHCVDLVDAARLLGSPDAAAEELNRSSTELAGAVAALLNAAPQRTLEGECSVSWSARMLQLSRDMRRMTQRVQEAMTPAPGDTETAAEDTPMDESLTDADMSYDVVVEDVDDGPLNRTKSQYVKQIKVNEVAKLAEERRAPVQELRRVLSQLDRSVGTITPDTEGAGNNAHYEQTAQKLKQIQKLQQSFREFGEDLMEGMLALDQLSGLAEQDRSSRKDTIRSIQGLLDEIDAAKPRVARVQKQLAEQIEQLKPPTPEPESPQKQGPPEAAQVPSESPSQNQEGTRAQAPAQRSARAPLLRPRVDWSQVKLPMRFSAVERPRAHFLSATAPGLDSESIRLHREGDVLSVEGARQPTPKEVQAITHSINEHVQKLAPHVRRSLKQQDIDEMAIQLGHGRFGFFVEEFKLPQDVDWENIEPSYEDGVLRIALPKRPAPSLQRMSTSRRPSQIGFPGSFYGGPREFLW